MATSGSCSNQRRGDKKSNENAAYTNEQLAAFEKVYAQCPYPSASQRQQMKEDHHALKDIEVKQIKLWFQNRRSQDKEIKKNNLEFDLIREKLIASNTILTEENDDLKKKVTELLDENDFLKQNCRMHVKSF
ncbi:hypothetical protein ACH5RR_018856 [Cinchona calisaya]|uniref:Homeobox domain-containing protein n=1 Tax=Cinchona calisaya TaxID=153742 RepID=A0ABD2ZMP7_9GENT